MIQNKQKYFQNYARINLDCVQVELSLVLICICGALIPWEGVRVLWFCLALCPMPCVSLICDRSSGMRVERTHPLCTPCSR